MQSTRFYQVDNNKLLSMILTKRLKENIIISDLNQILDDFIPKYSKLLSLTYK
jgi:hypothetical protein